MSRWIAALLLVLAPARAWAQASNSTVGVTATVIGSPVTFVNLQELDFATVTRGVPKSVAYGTASAGKVQVTGSSNAFAQIDFTLPGQLPNTQAPPGVDMPISFDPASAAWSRALDIPGAANSFDPASSEVGRFGPPPRPYLYVYLGGTVTPSPTQAAGIYQGTIILTITYL
ncbi:MAG TPA: hypothetical protein VFV65_08965 [Gemmatimonadales bacterium]|nr:hypothetical protein [Gemmatimonadales bacterium]